jgi:VWFA-related protein
MPRHCFLALLWLAAVLPIAAQEQKLAETIEVRITNVDVVVTDAKGNPVAGLTKDDFEVLEDKRPQTITNFYESRPENVGRPSGGQEITPAEESRAEARPAFERRPRKIIVFIDDFTVHPFRRNDMFASLGTFLDKNLGVTDEVMIVDHLHSTKAAVPFTGDLKRIHEALDKLRRENGAAEFFATRDRLKNEIDEEVRKTLDSNTGITPEAGYSEALSLVRNYAEWVSHSQRELMDAIADTISTFAGVEGRKVLVFAGGHLPERPGEDMFAYVDTAFASSVSMTNSAHGESQKYSQTQRIKDLANAANSAGVTLYTIGSQESGVVTPEVQLSQVELSPVDYLNTAMSLQTLARETGGVAVTNTAHFEVAFSTIARDLDTYYSLGYRSDASDEVQRNRNLIVRAKNRELRVRSRGSYTPKTSDEQTSDKVIANLFHEGVKGEMSLGLHVGAPVEHGHNQYRVPIEVSIPPTLILLPQGKDVAGGFTVYIVVGRADGSKSEVKKNAKSIRIPAGDEEEMRKEPWTYATALLVTPGEQTVSVAVVDQVASTIGFAKATFTAPAP